MTNPFFQVGAAFAALVLFSFVALEGKNVAQSIGLVNKPTLSRSDQIFVLQAMNDGLES